MSKDYYEILGVNRKATAAELQKAYRALAKKHHPDLNPDDKAAKQRFQEIQQAYDVLSDEKKRPLYDQFGPQYEQMGAGGGAPFGGGQVPPDFQHADFAQFFGGGGGGMGFEDLLRQFTGGGGPMEGGGRRRGRKQSSAPGADVRHELEVPFRQAVEGGEATLRIRRNGKTETVTIKIPAGIEPGKTIRLRGLGDASPGGGPPGDLLVTVQVAAHPVFVRDGLDLIAKVPITLVEAALGAKVEVPSPHGQITFSVPPGTSSGKKVRIKGQGIHAKTGEQGDLYAEIQIVLPKKLDSEAEELIRRLGEHLGPAPRGDLRW